MVNKRAVENIGILLGRAQGGEIVISADTAQKIVREEYDPNDWERSVPEILRSYGFSGEPGRIGADWCTQTWHLCDLSDGWALHFSSDEMGPGEGIVVLRNWGACESCEDCGSCGACIVEIAIIDLFTCATPSRC